MKKIIAAALAFLLMVPVFSQDVSGDDDAALWGQAAPASEPAVTPGLAEEPAPAAPGAPAVAEESAAPQTPPAPETPAARPSAEDAEDTKRLDTIRYGTETEIAALIQTLKTENSGDLDDELVAVAKRTRNRNILSGVFSFFANREKEGLEDRALQAIESRDDEDNETVLAALDYLGKVKSVHAVPYIQELLDAEERPFAAACIKALGLIGGSMRADSPPAAEAPLAVADPGTDEEAGALALSETPEDEAGDETGETITEGQETEPSQDDPEPPPPAPAPRRIQDSAAAVAEYLVNLYNERAPQDENRREIIIALGDVKSPAGIPLLREIAENSDERSALRMSALESLAKIGNSGGLDAVLLSVDSADPNVRSAAVAALGPFTGVDVDKAILEAFRDSYYRTRMAATQAARDRRLTEAIPYLRYRAERDDVPAVKDEAIKALGAIGTKECLEFLSSLFTERKNADRTRILTAEMLLQNNADSYAAKVIEELDEAKRKNQTALYNGFLRILGAAKSPVLEDLCKRFFSSGGVVEKSYALDMTANNNFRSLADQVKALNGEENGSLSRKSRAVVEKMGW
ncbi:MAG: HEAT repeat domain-containing protein [Treponema sp.]|jgi:HEAT repeat protein|nr:HEAT repeat domain-containing protein [Treponema sp.]